MPTLSAILIAIRPGLAAIGDDELALLVATARSCWPAIPIDDETFIAHLAERLPEGEDALRALRSVQAADLYLACGCARGLPEAITAFERTQMQRIDGAVERVDARRDFVDEVRQRLRERLLVGAPPRIASYSGSGSLAGWVRIAATRLALNLLRDMPPVADEESPPSSASDPERELMRGQHRHSVEAAFRAAFAQLDDDDRALLRLHYVDGVSLQELGRRQGVDRSTASRRLATVRDRLLTQTHLELQQLIPGLTPTSRDSLMVALRTQLDLSLDSLLV
jgi:RNA polymerase sigma-70 factor (ECF subfamily)